MYWSAKKVKDQRTVVKAGVHTKLQRRDRRIIGHHLPFAVGALASVALPFVTRPYRDWVSRASLALSLVDEDVFFMCVASIVRGAHTSQYPAENPGTTAPHRLYVREQTISSRSPLSGLN